MQIYFHYARDSLDKPVIKSARGTVVGVELWNFIKLNV